MCEQRRLFGQLHYAEFASDDSDALDCVVNFMTGRNHNWLSSVESGAKVQNITKGNIDLFHLLLCQSRMRQGPAYHGRSSSDFGC